MAIAREVDPGRHRGGWRDHHAPRRGRPTTSAAEEDDRMALALIKGMGLGAGLMYFFDPDLGRRRRALLADQMTHTCCTLEDFFGEATRDLSTRARGLPATLDHRMRNEPPPSDEVLVERVRAMLGRYVSHPRAIQVAAMRGHVVLRGPILASEVDGLRPAIASVWGVVDVADELEA